MKKGWLRIGLRLLTHTFYQLTVIGRENIPANGPAMFVSNHLSYVDPLLISACVPRPIRFLMWRMLHDDPRFAWFFRAMHAIPIAPTDTRRQLVTSLNEARHALEQGEQVGLFAEGEISRIAQLLGFKKGLETIAKELPIQIIPVNLDGLWGSMFSYERGRFFRKLPRHIPYHVTVSFGQPMPATTPAREVRHVIMDMGARAFEQRTQTMPTLPVAFLKRARTKWNAACVDGQTAGEMAVSAFLIAHVAASNSGDAPVGIRIEPSPLFALANLALAWAGKTAVLLDPSLSDDEFTKRRDAAGVRVVITDVPKTGALQRRLATLALRILPSGLTAQAHHQPNTIVVDPTPISFSTAHIQANITGLQEVFALGAEDTLTARVCVSDALTMIQSLWWPLLSGVRIRYEQNSSSQGSITVDKNGETRFVLNHDNAYVRADMGGAVCVNTADVQYGNEIQRGTQPGSMGRPLPGVAVRVVNGLLQIKGASAGDAKTPRPDGWIETGDGALIDDNGFVQRCNLSSPASVSTDAGTI